MKIEILKRPKKLRGWDWDLSAHLTHDCENTIHAAALTESLRKRIGPDEEIVGYRIVEDDKPKTKDDE